MYIYVYNLYTYPPPCPALEGVSATVTCTGRRMESTEPATGTTGGPASDKSKYIYTYIFIYIWKYTCTHIYIYANIHAYIHTCRHVHI